MTSVLLRAGAILGVWMLLVFAATAPVCAQTSNPTEAQITEGQLLQRGPVIRGRSNIPDTRSSTLEQSAGRDWRHFQEVTLPRLGGVAILGVLGLLIVFYLFRGMIRLEAGRSGRVLMRFNAFERFVHWMTAASFVILGVTGINITFGKTWLLPYVGADAFATWSQWAKYAHDYLSFPFTLGVVLIFLMWLAWSFPGPTDVEWLAGGGGIVGHRHPDAHRFNAGQKVIYWIAVLGGGAVAASGYLLMFPFYATDVASLQSAQMVHGIVAMLYVAAMIAHAYIGTIGMEGAFEGMWNGTVDENWAREHHSLWYLKEKARSHPPAPPRETRTGGRAIPAE